MAETVLDWLFAGGGVANMDSTMPAVVQGASEVQGPGSTAFGERLTALRFGAGVSCTARLPPGRVDSTRFAVRILFRVTSPVTTRGNLMESTGLPVTLFVEPGTAADRFNVGAGLANSSVGWTIANTANRKRLTLNQWYVASLVYDLDTLALLIDDQVVAVSAFPLGRLQAPRGDQLFVGTWVDGRQWPFRGEIAGLQVWLDIPEALEARLDADRGTPEWHLTRKENELRPALNLGPKTGDFYFDPAIGSYVQSYALAVISYTESHGVAFEMHGAILAKWRSNETLRRALGPLVSDEIDGRQSGSRKSLFRNGGIYWSPASGAFPVLDRMYLDFELLGEGSSPIGLPVADAEVIAGGKVQRFQAGKMYLRDGGSNAFEVHGAILAKYDASGGADRWGFPVTHESPVLRRTTEIGRSSEFERCTILWSPRTPASVIYGAIRATYRAQGGGPSGDLGFPTSDESDIPGAPGYARYNTFQRGSILFLNDRSIVCWPFKFWLGRLDTNEEDRDVFDADGQNDLYARVSIDINGGPVFDRRIPEGGGHYPSANIYDLRYEVPYEILPNTPDLRVHLRVEVWESDGGSLFSGGDDALGTVTKELTMANAWGLTENAAGVFTTRDLGPWVNSLDWSIKPQVGAHTPFDNWGAINRSTASVDWREYAAAFSDVDPDFEFDFGIVDDGLKALYYELVVKGLAAGGNCFGMSLEAIYAWKEMSRLGRPLARFTNWRDVENDFNVRHTYQAGADAIWWFLGQFLSGNTHDPKSVFQSSWDAFNRGMNPVLCVAQNYDFSGAPHCIIPTGWDRGSTPWRIQCLDPNLANTPTTIFIEPGDNTFSYDNGTSYRGGEWSGGRLQYMPFSVLNHTQRTPVWDAILLLLGGMVVFFGDGAEVSSLSDENGNSLDGSLVRSRDMLAGKLLRIQGLSGNGPVKGSVYVGRQEQPLFVFNPGVIRAVAAHTALLAQPGILAPVSRPDKLRDRLVKTPSVRPPVASDAPSNAIAGAALMELMRREGAPFFRPTRSTDLDIIRAVLRGKANGKLDGYLKQGLRGIRVQGDVALNENVALGFERLGARDNEINVKSDRARVYDVTLVNKLGAGKDFLKVTLSGLPAEASKATRLNAQPGIGVLDVITPGLAANARVLVDGVVHGQALKSAFNVRLEDGIRLVLPGPVDPGRLKVGSIDRLLGEGRGFRLILGQ